MFWGSQYEAPSDPPARHLYYDYPPRPKQHFYQSENNRYQIFHITKVRGDNSLIKKNQRGLQAFQTDDLPIKDLLGSPVT